MLQLGANKRGSEPLAVTLPHLSKGVGGWVGGCLCWWVRGSGCVSGWVGGWVGECQEGDVTEPLAVTLKGHLKRMLSRYLTLHTHTHTQTTGDVEQRRTIFASATGPPPETPPACLLKRTVCVLKRMLAYIGNLLVYDALSY